MDWIKRNMFFLIGAVVAAALLGFAGYYNFRGWQHFDKEKKELNGKYAELERLINLKPHPGFGKVDNIKAARDYRKSVDAVMTRATKYFNPLPAIPDATNVTSAVFQSALRRTIDQLTREAANVSVGLPPEYKFSFYQQFRLLNFAPGSLERLSVQLGEIKALCDVLLQAKVNYLDNIQRERVSDDDNAGPQTDYLPVNSVSQTNDLGRAVAVRTPYQITFRSFSPEIAQVLAGFASSSYGMIVRGINVEPSPAAAEPAGVPGAIPSPTPYFPAAPVAPQYGTAPRNVVDEEERERRALRPDLYRVAPPPTYYRPTYGTPAIPGARGATASQTVLNEKQLRITLRVEVVKLLPKS